MWNATAHCRGWWLSQAISTHDPSRCQLHGQIPCREKEFASQCFRPKHPIVFVQRSLFRCDRSHLPSPCLKVWWNWWQHPLDRRVQEVPCSHSSESLLRVSCKKVMETPKLQWYQELWTEPSQYFQLEPQHFDSSTLHLKLSLPRRRIFKWSTHSTRYDGKSKQIETWQEDNLKGSKVYWLLCPSVSQAELYAHKIIQCWRDCCGHCQRSKKGEQDWVGMEWASSFWYNWSFNESKSRVLQYPLQGIWFLVRMQTSPTSIAISLCTKEWTREWKISFPWSSSWWSER